MAAGRHPLVLLVAARWRTLLREPSTLFWLFGFPLLTSLALGVAFRNRDLDRLQVAVVESPGAAEAAKAIDGAEGLAAVRVTEAEARDRLRRGRVALVVVPGEKPDLLLDPTMPDGRTARALAVDALERAAGRKDLLAPTVKPVTAPGSRYIDFLIPGLLGMGLMSASIWSVGWTLVQMRVGKLLKRFSATPMRRSDFLLSFVLMRAVVALVEIVFIAAMARVLFDVRVFGSLLDVILLGLAGALSFGGVALLGASRTRTLATASGILNAVTMPMIVLSGVFFSPSKFPDWAQPVINGLPLTALNEGLRAIMIDGTPLWALWPKLLVLAIWGGLSFGIALRIFRWKL
jgi:ABC-type multidrug transport system permease subunit